VSSRDTREEVRDEMMYFLCVLYEVMIARIGSGVLRYRFYLWMVMGHTEDGFGLRVYLLDTLYQTGRR
jgi:hypothetical protein